MTLPERARSFVDPKTNEMVVSDFDLPAYLAWVRGRPVSGSGVLANFLHEWTHRWCFHSPVGSALALLRMRAACRVFRGREAFDDYVRCMTGGTVLEPFAEGLALFAEFDTYPGDSPWLSQTLTASTIFFAPAVDTGDRPLLLIQGLLQQLRRDPQLLVRKAGIYGPPIGDSDQYLVGYLSVRSLWCQMAAACPALGDRDLFLSYLRSYLYDDPRMVVRILDSYPSEVHAAEAITNHLLSRVRQLVSFDGLAERVDLWLRSAETGAVDVASILGETADERRAEELINLALVADMLEEPGEPNETLGAWVLMTLEERRICVVVATTVGFNARPGSDRLDVVVPGDGEPLASVAATAVGATTEGELAVVSSSNGHGMAVLLRVDRTVTMLSSFGRFQEEELEIAKRHVANRPVSRSLHETFEKALESSPVVATVWEFVSRHVSPALRELFGPLATLNMKEAEWGEPFEQLRRGGLYGVLGCDGELTSAVAAIGLVNTISTDVYFVRLIGRLLGADDEALERAMELASCKGLPIVARKGEQVIALV